SPSQPRTIIIAFQGVFDVHFYAVTIRKPVLIMSIDEVGSKNAYPNWTKYSVSVSVFMQSFRITSVPSI
ncbi:hypothetical protein, partial [Reinekea sp.]|uniref:hypothetical protein n=1 Tax=Reinekea sp. TaxID=1970455 RepID=UPI00257B85A6